MVLDGRRRRLALILLRDRGDLSDDDLVDCLLAGDKAAQAAAVVLPNAERAPVHTADVIVAIGRLRKSRMDTGAISRALGYSELEIRRLEALAGVHPTVLKAFRQGRLTLKQVRLFARLPDKARQADIAQTALDGYFQDYQLRHVVDQDRATAEDERLILVGLDRYVAAGGRVDADLFGELPDRLLDPDVLQEAWVDRIKPVVGRLQEGRPRRLRRSGEGLPRPRRLLPPPLRLSSAADRGAVRAAGLGKGGRRARGGRAPDRRSRRRGRARSPGGSAGRTDARGLGPARRQPGGRRPADARGRAWASRRPSTPSRCRRRPAPTRSRGRKRTRTKPTAMRAGAQRHRGPRRRHRPQRRRPRLPRDAHRRRHARAHPRLG